MQLPQSQNDEGSQELWHKEILRLKERIERDFSVTISDEALREAIRLKNKERMLLKEFYGLSKFCPPPMTGLEQHKVLYGVQFKFDMETKLQEIRETIDRIKAEQAQGISKVPASLKRILITGCPLAGATEKVIVAIEESGGVVVAYENCGGVKSVDRLVDETIDPCRAIAERYLQIGCSIMTPNNNRMELLTQLIREFKVDGVVEMTLQACHTYNVETEQVRKLMEKQGVPFISVETDYSTLDTAQIKTRMAAFIEMLE
jgi:benzoyl-CoA reductase/2-hydroxyglutaryl-CoA dehydratase subunit BcrC/BadD/HgdB